MGNNGEATASRCVWLLDIDGVVNALPRRRDGAPVWPSYRRAWVRSSSGGRWEFHVAEGLAEFIRAQHGAGRDIRWATTWQQEANTAVAAKFKLPTLPVGAPVLESGDFQYKQRAALELARAGVALVWTDDDAIDRRTKDELSAIGNPVLLIEPHPGHGLTPQHCDEIAAFMQRWQ